MKIEIKIGRDVEGTNVLHVPSTCKKVSRRHASLFWNNGILIIEDNESSNGTFVNGKRIAKSKIKEDDVVWLGSASADEEAYHIDLEKIFNSCRNIEKAQRTDYTEEFTQIKKAYMDYQREVSNLKQKAMTRTQMPRLLATFIPAVIGLVIVLTSKDITLRIVSMSIGSVLSGLVGMVSMGKSTSANDRISDEITELQIKYQSHYCCPKCGMKYPFTMHWKKLQAEGKCPNPQCNAFFVK